MNFTFNIRSNLRFDWNLSCLLMVWNPIIQVFCWSVLNLIWSCIFFIFLFLEERDIKVEQNFIFNFVFNESRLQNFNWANLKLDKVLDKDGSLLRTLFVIAIDVQLINEDSQHDNWWTKNLWLSLYADHHSLKEDVIHLLRTLMMKRYGWSNGHRMSCDLQTKIL